MSFVAVAVTTAAVGTIYAANQAGDAAEDAAQAQVLTGDAAIDFQRESRDLAREDLQQFVTPGVNALQELESITPESVNEPLFRALNKRTLPAINEARAASGLLNSRGTVDQISDRLFDNFMIAGPQLQNQRFNQLFNIANLGQSSAAGQANTAVTTGQGVANTLAGIGNAQAQGHINKANAVTGGFNALAQIPGAMGFSFKRSS